jgi:hypothetical protein
VNDSNSYDTYRQSIRRGLRRYDRLALSGALNEYVKELERRFEQSGIVGANERKAQ